MLHLARAATRLNPWPAAGWPGAVAALVASTIAGLYAAAMVAQLLAGTAGARPDGMGAWAAEDYVAYLTGAALLAGGQASQLYDRSAQLAIQQALVARPLTTLNAYVNPPAWALAFAALLPLGLVGAGVVFKLASLATGVLALRKAAASRLGVAGALALLGSAPFLVGWLFGGMVAVLLLAFGGWLWLLRAGRPLLAGAALSLLLLKPQYAPVPLLYLLWKRQWRQAAGFALGAAVQGGLTLLSLALLGGTPRLDDLLQFTTPDGGDTRAGIGLHVSVRRLLVRMAPDLGVEAFYSLAAGLTLMLLAGFFALSGRAWRVAEPEHFAWETLGLAAVVNLTAFHNHVTGLVLLLPPAALALSRDQVDWRAGCLAVLLAAPSLPLLLWPLDYGPFVGASWLLAMGALGLWLSRSLAWKGSLDWAAPFRAAFGRVWTVLWGTNPWPAAGWPGRAAAAVMLVGALAYLLSQLPTGGFGGPAERFFGNDFVAYLTGTALLLQGDAHRLYDYARQFEVQQAMMASLGLETRGMEYVNPPLWAALLVPLFPLGLYAADLVWRVLSLVGSAWSLFRMSPASAAARRGALLLLCFFPFVQGLHHRSMVLVLVAGFAGWAAFGAARRPFAAGLALSLLGLKPQYVFFPFLFLVWRGEWTQLRGFVIGGVAQILATLLIMLAPGQGLPSFEAVAPFIGIGNLGAGNSGAVVDAHVNLRAAIVRLLPDAPTALQLGALALVSTAAIGMVLGLMGRRGAPRAPLDGWALLAVAAAANLTAPYNHATGLVLLLPPAAMLLCQAGVPARSAAALAVAMALPSAGILLAPLSPSIYIATCWLTTLAALGLGLAHVQRERTARPQEAA